MSDKWSLLCLLITYSWVWFLLGYSVFAIAYASYGMGYSKGTQCRSLDDAIWLSDSAGALCDYLLFGKNDNKNKSGINDPPIVGAAAAKTHCLLEMKNLAASITNVAEHQCPDSRFTLSPPWNWAFWAGVGLFACSWILFGFFLGSMAVEACRDEFRRVEDELRKMEGFGNEKHGGVEEGGLEGRRILLN